MVMMDFRTRATEDICGEIIAAALLCIACSPKMRRFLADMEQSTHTRGEGAFYKSVAGLESWEREKQYGIEREVAGAPMDET